MNFKIRYLLRGLKKLANLEILDEKLKMIFILSGVQNVRHDFLKVVKYFSTVIFSTILVIWKKLRFKDSF